MEKIMNQSLMGWTSQESSVGIRQHGVPYGLLYRRTEPRYVLDDGTVGGTPTHEEPPEPASIRDRLRQYEEQSTQGTRADDKKQQGRVRLHL